MPDFVAVASVDEVKGASGYVTTVGGMEIALFEVDGDWYAVENVCPHRGGPIGEGEVEDGIVSCPWHAWPFDLETGVCTINPSASLRTCEVRVEEGQVKVAVTPRRS